MLTLAENIFSSGSKIKKQPIWAKIVQKWLFVTLAILNVDVSNKINCELYKILRNI